MNLPEAVDRQALKVSSFSAKCRGLSSLMPPKLHCLMTFSCLAEWNCWEKLVGWDRWQTHTGIFISSMSFKMVYNLALFILAMVAVQSHATHSLLLHSKRPYCPKSVSLFFSEAKRFRNLIVTLQLQGKTQRPPRPPKQASLDSSAAFCFIMLILLFLRQITCSPHKNWHIAGRDEKVNAF